jgi:lipopolysaccharide/colanic/teichoic acid biosynthesis glycosyltransferase
MRTAATVCTIGGSDVVQIPSVRWPGIAAARRAARPVPVGARLSRIVDVVGAAVLLVLLAPLLVLIALLVRAGSPGPAVFRQTRIGHDKRPFVMLKFRSMRTDCDDRLHRDFVRRMFEGGDPREGRAGVFKLRGDSRVTPIGRVLRASSLDELPQLVNVLRGEMALVGPRPALAWEVDLYQPHHHERFTVKPGITGLWQVSGRSRLTTNQALELDVEYARRRSLRLDLVILLRTIPALLPSRTA